MKVLSHQKLTGYQNLGQRIQEHSSFITSETYRVPKQSRGMQPRFRRFITSETYRVPKRTGWRPIGSGCFITSETYRVPKPCIRGHSDDRVLSHQKLTGYQNDAVGDTINDEFYHIRNLQGTKTSNGSINLRSDKITNNHSNKNNLQGFTAVGIFQDSLETSIWMWFRQVQLSTVLFW